MERVFLELKMFKIKNISGSKFQQILTILSILCLSSLMSSKNLCNNASLALIRLLWSNSNILSSKSKASGSFIWQSLSQPIFSFYISSGIKHPYPYLKAISFIAFDPNKQVSGIRLDIVKFLIFEELFSEKTGWRPAQKDRNITPHAQMSTADVYVW